MVWRRLAGPLLAVMLAMPSQAADFRLLRLDGHTVKWGEPVLGEGAALTWSFAERRHVFPDAINCRVLEPLAGILKTAGVAPGESSDLFQDAFGLWEEVAGLTFTYVSDEDAADILIGAQGEPTGIAFTNVWHEPHAETTVATLTRATICFNPLMRWESRPDGSNDTYEIRHVAAHEIGHAIGLDHPGPTGALMGYQYDEGSGLLQAGDVTGAVTLYGLRSTDAD
ncbi:MAG: matrixin family metalloprotease [Kiloniellales bacterium]